MDQKELDNAIELHRKWLHGEDDGVRMEFDYLDLAGLNFYEANLTKASLIKANLTNANLEKALLRGTNLRSAILHMSNLHNALLYLADFTRADLSNANLTNTRLPTCPMGGACLRDTNLTGTEINWDSHWLISELLFRAADTDSRLDTVQIVRSNPDLCWREFFAMKHPEQEWALSELRKYLLPNERHYILGTQA